MTETELKPTAAAIIVGLLDARKRLENTRSNRHAKHMQIEAKRRDSLILLIRLCSKAYWAKRAATMDVGQPDLDRH